MVVSPWFRIHLPQALRTGKPFARDVGEVMWSQAAETASASGVPERVKRQG